MSLTRGVAYREIADVNDIFDFDQKINTYRLRYNYSNVLAGNFPRERLSTEKLSVETSPKVIGRTGGGSIRTCILIGLHLCSTAIV